MKQLIIGLGTGRCGTMSLTKLLSAQENTVVTHELAPYLSWSPSRGRGWLADRFIQMAQGDEGFGGAVSFFNLPYVPLILAAVPSVKFICLKRNRTETIRSFSDKILFEHGTDTDHWRAKRDGLRCNEWDHCFPKYDVASMYEGVSRYWFDYYHTADLLEKEMPGSFHVFDVNDLSAHEGVMGILMFAGYTKFKVEPVKENSLCERK